MAVFPIGVSRDRLQYHNNHGNKDSNVVAVHNTVETIVPLYSLHIAIMYSHFLDGSRMTWNYFSDFKWQLQGFKWTQCLTKICGITIIIINMSISSINTNFAYNIVIIGHMINLFPCKFADQLSVEGNAMIIEWQNVVIKVDLHR